MTDKQETWLNLPNGGQIEKSYLTDNVISVRQYTNFKKVIFADLANNKDTHAHCDICWQTIADIKNESTADGGYKSNNTWVCESCYSLFIDTDDYKKSITHLTTIDKLK
jgi:hypothetical protein